MANSSRKVKKAELERQAQTEREIIGICFIALALFLAAGIYTDMVGVIGNAAKNLTFGLFGIAGYAAPFILAGLGILSIAMSKSPASSSTLWLIVGGVVCLLVIIHTATRGEITVDKVTAYYSDAYMYGKLYCKGGGLLGALLAYPSMKLLGAAGTYIRCRGIYSISGSYQAFHTNPWPESGQRHKERCGNCLRKGAAGSRP